MARTILPLLSLLLLVPPVAQAKIPDDAIKIGVLQDLPAPYAADPAMAASSRRNWRPAISMCMR